MTNKNTLALLLSVSLIASPAFAQQTNEPVFRMQLKAPIHFTGGTPGPADPGPIENEPEVVELALAAHSFPDHVVGNTFSYDFKSLLSMSSGTIGDVEWSLGTPNELPVGFSSNGVASGQIETAGEYDFQIVANHADATAPAQRVYTIVVNGVELNVVQISAGTQHACAIAADLTAWCWGTSNQGALGHGTLVPGASVSSSVPMQVVGPEGTGFLTGVTQIGVGSNFSCALNQSGVWCWGSGNQGRLGDNRFASSAIPVQVASASGSGALTGVSQIAVGDHHTCALNSSGAWCWGVGGNGRLGISSTANAGRPVQVLNATGSGPLTGVNEISAGQYHTCARIASTAWCWGQGLQGRLGTGGTIDNSLLPEQVVGIGGIGLLNGVTQISAGGDHTCAVANGQALCWGAGGNGRLGYNGLNLRQHPMEVVGTTGSGILTGIARISAGRSHTCAVRTSGDVLCWGANADGQLGDGSNTDRLHPVPLAAPIDSSVAPTMGHVVSGNRFTCAASSDMGWCWGYGAAGQLGSGANDSVNRPTALASP